MQQTEKLMQMIEWHLIDRTCLYVQDGLPQSKREMCIRELVITEGNYISAIQMIREVWLLICLIIMFYFMP